MKNYLLLFCIVVILKIALNLYYYLFAKHYWKEYLKSIEDRTNWYISNNKQQIIKLLKKAGIKDTAKNYLEDAGFGKIEKKRMTIFNSICSSKEYVVRSMAENFAEAINVFKKRIFNSINPIYWIELILCLPQNILEYLKVPSEDRKIKILNVVWWFCLLFISIIFANSISITLNDIILISKEILSYKK
ncbi:MAG: hypothetical protein GY793_08975 [Proteobacteria bacterium]|nr:hypothetical protein [Pseudomonadota bacterium]